MRSSSFTTTTRASRRYSITATEVALIIVLIILCDAV